MTLSARNPTLTLLSKPEAMAETTTQNDLRQIILDQARKMMVSEGYNSLSMRKIASRAGYSATSIYLHFKNKDDLLHALMDEGFEELYQLIVEELKPLSDPLEKIERVCRSYIRFGLNQPEYYEIMFLMHPEDMKRYPPEKYRKARRTIYVLKDILEKGELTNGTLHSRPDLEAYSIWSSVHGAIAAIHAGRLDNRIDQDEFLESVINGIVNRYSG